MKLSQPQEQRLSPAWVPRLPNNFTETGLTVSDSDVREAYPALALAYYECALQIHVMMAEMTKNNEVARRLKEIILQVQEDTRKVAHFSFTWWTVVGQEPAAAQQWWTDEQTRIEQGMEEESSSSTFPSRFL
jgi:hypothetical protein